MNAQISACRICEQRTLELIAKFGPDAFEEAIEEILSHDERIARARLAQLPNGTWSAEDYVDDDCVDLDRLVKPLPVDDQHLVGDRDRRLE